MRFRARRWATLQLPVSSLRPLLSDLFEHITLWYVSADSVRAEPMEAGAYRVTLFAGIDPFRKLIERERDDNFAEVGSTPNARGGGR